MNLKTTFNLDGLAIEAKISLVSMLAVVLPLISFVIISIYSTSETLTSVIKKELEEKSVLVAYNINPLLFKRLGIT